MDIETVLKKQRDLSSRFGRLRRMSATTGRISVTAEVRGAGGTLVSSSTGVLRSRRAASGRTWRCSTRPVCETPPILGQMDPSVALCSCDAPVGPRRTG